MVPETTEPSGNLMAQPVVVPRSRASRPCGVEGDRTGAEARPKVWGSVMVDDPFGSWVVMRVADEREAARNPLGVEVGEPACGVLHHPRRGWVSPPKLVRKRNTLMVFANFQFGQFRDTPLAQSACGVAKRD